jgi:hypothetical protein
MTTYSIANFIFWGFLVSVAIFVYQGIILPGIRLGLRYRVFRLRDQLRRLVIEGQVEESDKSFLLLHERLNIMCRSLARFDLARVVQGSHNLDDESRAQIATYTRVMETAPEEVQKIFKESLSVFMLALTFNSLFFFVIASLCLLVGVALKSSFRHAKELFWQKVDADTTMAFFSPELATV